MALYLYPALAIALLWTWFSKVFTAWRCLNFQVRWVKLADQLWKMSGLILGSDELLDRIDCTFTHFQIPENKSNLICLCDHLFFWLMVKVRLRFCPTLWSTCWFSFIQMEECLPLFASPSVNNIGPIWELSKPTVVVSTVKGCFFSCLTWRFICLTIRNFFRVKSRS